MLDEQNPGPSRIVFRDDMEAQVLPAPGSSTSAAMTDGIEHGSNPPGESFRQISSIAADVHATLPVRREYQRHRKGSRQTSDGVEGYVLMLL